MRRTRSEAPVGAAHLRRGGGRGRQAGRAALLALPLVAVLVIAVLSTGVVDTLGQFTASITNPNGNVESGSVGLAESDAGGDVCSAPADGQWVECGAIDKFGGGTIASGATRVTTVTLENTGTSPAQLFVLPSQCSDSLTGAHGALCDAVTVTVTCGGTTVVPARSLNAFHDQRNYPTGYAAGTLAAGTSTTCDFALVASAIPQPGTVSQPIAWTLRAGA